MSKYQNNHNDYMIFHSKLSVDRMSAAYQKIREVLPAFQQGKQVNLKDLDIFLTKKYKAVKANWKDIDSCTKTKVKRYNKYCKTVFCVSEAHVTDDEYYCSYIIKRENLINPPFNKDDFFYDMFIIVGSEDKIHLSSYFIGGSSEGFADEFYVLCGNN